ncbi:MAG: hypothetical protein QXS91_03305 [Candidatus Anstonellales archaeon]
MDELDEFYSANSEIRYITIELMKISARRKQPFSVIAREFVKNAKMLQFLIKKSAKKKKAGS